MIVDVDEGRFDPVARERLRQERERPSVELTGGDDAVAEEARAQERRVIAAIPLANASASSAPSRSATAASNASIVGLAQRV